jgi:hypothetical protein
MLNTIEIISVKIQQNGWLLNENVYVPDAPGNSERESILAWIAKGNTPLPQDALTQDQLNQQAKAAVYTLLDTTAQEYNYRNFSEVVQFVNSSEWKVESNSLLAWQDIIWTKAYELLKAPITTVEEFVVQLPKYAPSNEYNISSITPRQVRLQLTAIGMRQAVEDYVASSAQDVKDWWEFSTSIERNAPLLVTTAALLGMSSTQLDQFFVEASKL